jgi:spermidine/putrescine transport system permease protein
MSRPSNRFRLADWLLVLEWYLVLAFLYLPIGILIVFSFNRSRLTATWEGFTLDWYRALLANQQLLGSLWNSLIVAVLTTAIATVLGTAAAYAMDRALPRGQDAIEGLVHLPIIIPEIVTAASLVIFFGMAGIRLSLVTVVLAHVAFSISYVILTVRSRLAGMERSLEEAAMDLGADEWTTFRTVTLPHLFPAIVSSGLLVFTLSIDDYVITSFVAGTGSTTLPLQIYSMVKQGVTPEINAVSSLLLVGTLVLAGIAQALSGKLEK